jgi:SAM-dependent methyltransferase
MMATSPTPAPNLELTMLSNGKALFGLKDDAEWLELLIRSVREPVINGVEMPRFPHARIQSMFVGSADEHALREGYNFYVYVKGYADALGKTLYSKTQLLDFGSGWGRYARFFWNDIDEDSIFGVDVDPDMVSLCRALGVPGRFDRIEPRGVLPFPDQTFDVITAYSVFSHLSEPVAAHWMAELSRVAKPGCVFAYTTEPRRFLDFIQDIPPDSTSAWHRALANFQSAVPGLRARFDEGKFCYLPTSGGEHREADAYGDAIVPQDYIIENWEKYFHLVRYIDDPACFWQAFVVTQRQ